MIKLPCKECLVFNMCCSRYKTNNNGVTGLHVYLMYNTCPTFKNWWELQRNRIIRTKPIYRLFDVEFLFGLKSLWEKMEEEYENTM